MSLKYKRNLHILIILLLVLGLLVVVLGDQRIIAYTNTRASNLADTQQTGIDHTNSVDLFDDTVVHSIQVLMSEEDYDQMIATYQKTGLKEYFPVDVIIDGVRVNQVGIRLKGNASLRQALGGGMRGGYWEDRWGGGEGQPIPPVDNFPQGREQRPDQPPEGDRLPFGPQNRPGQGEAPQGRQLPQFPGADQFPQGEDGLSQGEGGFPQWEGEPPQGFGMRPDTGNSDGKANIPFMIKFNEYVSGQTYQEYENIAIRTYGVQYDAAMLAEPVSNEMVQWIGLPAAQTAFMGFQVNGGVEQLYVVSEVINEDYLAKYFDNANGVLYKAEVGSSLTYVGDDPSAYTKSFSQQTRLNDADLAPLIAFARFLTESDDATFESELPGWLDVESFAAYLAINNLLVNTDSIIGMNNNYYLYYDDSTQRFTLLLWDTNESMGGLGGRQVVNYDLYFSSQLGMRTPGGGSQNILFKRFMATPSFKALYEAKLQSIYQQVFLSGAITEQVETYANLVSEAVVERNLGDPESYSLAVDNTLSFLEQRMAYLYSTALLDDP